MKQAKVRHFVDGSRIGGVNVHVVPSKHSRVLDAFRPGQEVSITQRRENAWAEVWCSTPKSEHTLGWVPEKYLEMLPERCEPLKAPAVLIPVPETRLFRPGVVDIAVALAVGIPLLLAAAWAILTAL